jgi:hypothetical protein
MENELATRLEIITAAMAETVLEARRVRAEAQQIMADQR